MLNTGQKNIVGTSLHRLCVFKQPLMCKNRGSSVGISGKGPGDAAN